MREYDAIIIGTGQAGPSLARRLAAAGQKVAIIERKLFGGTCVNTGCTPTKTMVASAYAAHLARRARRLRRDHQRPDRRRHEAVKARKDARHGRSLATGVETLARDDARAAPFTRVTRAFASTRLRSATATQRRADLHQRRRTRVDPADGRPGQHALPDQQLDDGRRFRCRRIWSSSAAATSASSSRRCIAASAATSP